MPSLRALSKALEGFFTSKEQVELPQNVLDLVVEYAETFSYSDPVDSPRLQEELISIHQHVNEPKYKVPFLEVLIHLLPCLTTSSQLKYWFGQYIHAALNSAGQLNVLVTASREFLVAVMVSDYEIDDIKLKKVYNEISKEYCMWILDIYLGISEWFPEQFKDIKDEERVRFMKMNAKDLLVQFGVKNGKIFMESINGRMIMSKYRIQTLVLLSVYSSQQPLQLYEIQNTPLLESMCQCLEYDLSSTALTICANTLAMALPHITNQLFRSLPRILALYGRLASWRYVMEEQDFDYDYEFHEDEQKELEEPKPRTPGPNSKNWDSLGHLAGTQEERKPAITPMFTFLYGMFPSNLLSFLRKATKYLEKRAFTREFNDFFDDGMILAMSRPIFDLHMLHPSLVSNTAEQELHDVDRFRNLKLGSPTAVASYCLALYNQTRLQKNEAPQDPTFEIPFEELPTLFNGDIPNYSYIFGGVKDKRLDNAADAEDEASDDYDANGEKVLPANDRAVMPARQQALEDIINQHGNLYQIDGRENEALSPTELTLNPVEALRSRSTTLSSPGLLPLHKSPSSTPINTSQVSSPVMERKNSLGSAVVGGVSVSRGSIASLDEMDSSNLKQRIIEQHEQILFLNRELMIQKNELDFVSFIEHHTQYRYKEMYKELIKLRVDGTRIDNLAQRSHALQSQLQAVKHELVTQQKNTKTYKRERQQYEQSIMDKSKEFKKSAADITAERDRIHNNLVDLQKEKEALNETMMEQEIKITELELRLTEAQNKSQYVDSYRTQLMEVEKQRDELELSSIIGTGDVLSLTESEALRKMLADLTIERDALEEELAQTEQEYKRQMEDTRARVIQLEDQLSEPSKKFEALAERYRESRDSHYIELKEAHEDLTKRYLTLHTQFRNLIVEEEDRGVRENLITLPGGNNNLPHKSLLGYDIDLSEAGSIHSSGHMSDGHNTPPLLPQDSNKPRIRGRGGVQNTGSNPPSRKPSKQFRGIRKL